MSVSFGSPSPVPETSPVGHQMDGAKSPLAKVR